MKRAKDDRLKLEEELRGLKDILSVAQVVVSSLELDEVLENILGSVMAVLEMPAGSVALYDPRTNQLEIHAHHGLSDRFLALKRWPVKMGGLTQTILNAGELFLVEDTAKTKFFTSPLAIEEGIRSMVAVPLKIQNKIVGIIYVNDFVPRGFSEIRLRLLSILGSFAAMSIDNARLHERTRELACTDGLTGLYNHRHFKKLFAEEMGRAKRYQRPTSLMMFDIDDFKTFNDRYGHPVGDKVLIAVAEILQDTLRDCDPCFRYGGEEFISILPQTDIQEALVAAERCRELIAAESGRYLDRELGQRITVSVGVASFPRDAQDGDGLLKVVDDLMYMAKRQGKNQVHHLE